MARILRASWRRTPGIERCAGTTKAVDYCKAEWQKAYDLAQSKGLASAKALRMASVAYKLAMPKMDNLPAIHAR